MFYFHIKKYSDHVTENKRSNLFKKVYYGGKCQKHIFKRFIYIKSVGILLISIKEKKINLCVYYNQ